MTINTILNIGVSGLQTAQTGLRVASDNISNVNTPGYIRKLVDQSSLHSGGVGSGVDASRVRLAIDRYLQQATFRSTAEAARTGATAELYDRAQSYFGDPSDDDSFFGRLDSVFTSFSATADDPASSPARQQAANAVSSFFAEADRIGQGIQAVRKEADSRIGSAVSKVNDLLKQIEALNQDISRQTVAGRDASGAQGQQAQLVDQLSSMMDIRVQDRAQGGVTLRTGDGMLLAGQGAASLAYTPSASGGQGGFGALTITPPGGATRPLMDHLQSGELKGLVDLRDGQLASMQAQLSAFTSASADALNRVHNAGSSVPAPSALSGRNIGLDLPTAVGGFTGKTTVELLDAQGKPQRRVDIDFSAGTMSVDGGAASGFTPGSFVSSLNGALSPMGSASFSGGTLSLAGTSGLGVAVADDATTPGLKAGKGFSDFFGLNDLVRSSRITDFDTGLTTADAHGFTAGQTFTLRLATAGGAPLKDITVAVPAGGTMADLLAAMNSPSSGAGLYGSFGLDANGRMAFTPSTQPPASLSVVNDTTERGAGGPTLSELFGLPNPEVAASPAVFTLRADVAADPRKLALARLDLTAGSGSSALAIGDARGAQALATAGAAATAGGATLSQRAASFSGALGAAAQEAQSRADAASAVATETSQQRSNQEGVNLDEELVKLTTFQQAFNASSRLIQAAKDMYDVLLQMT